MMAESLSFAPGLAAARRAAGRIATLLADDKTCDKLADTSDSDDSWVMIYLTNTYFYLSIQHINSANCS